MSQTTMFTTEGEIIKGTAIEPEDIQLREDLIELLRANMPYVGASSVRAAATEIVCRWKLTERSIPVIRHYDGPMEAVVEVIE